MRAYQSWLLAGFLSVLVLQLTACGFQLRGSQSVGSLPFSQAQLQLSAGVNSEVADATALELQQAGVAMADNAAWVVTLMKTQTQVSQTSTNGLGDAASELIKMTQAFSIEQKIDGKTVEGSKYLAQVSAFRDRRIDQNAMLASDLELQQLKRDMADELAQKLVYRLSRSFAEPKK